MTELPDELQSIQELVDRLSLAKRIIAGLRKELEAARARCEPGYAATVAERLHEALRELYRHAVPTIERKAAVRARTALNETLLDLRAWRDIGYTIGTSEVDAARKELAELHRMRPIAELHEDHGDVLLWRVPIEEPPIVGSSLDHDFKDNLDYYEITHWSPLPQPVEPGEPDEGDASSGCPPHWLRVDVHPDTAAEPDRCVDCGHCCGSPDCKMRHGDR